MGWFDKIETDIQDVFDNTRGATPSLPTMMLSVETSERSGMSAIALTSNIIERLPEAGVETGVNVDGSPNVIGEFIRILVEELIKEIKENGKITIAIPPGAIVTLGTGANAGGPITLVSQNTTYTSATGLLE